MISVNVLRTRPAVAAARLLRPLLYGAFVIGLVALAAALALAAAPRLFGYGTLVVQGASMGDTIPIGSLVIARWNAAEDIEVGDVILIQEERDYGEASPKLHRVVLLDEEGGRVLARTKGDANQTVDPKLYILPDRVATPALTVPYLGYLAGFAMTGFGWVFLVLLPAIVLAHLTLRDIWADDDAPATESATT